MAPGGGAVVEVRRREDLVASGVRQAAVHEAIEVFGGAVELLGCRHVPAVGAPVAGVVVCSVGPFDAAVDTSRSARLGRRLARLGLAVQRYHLASAHVGARAGAPGSDSERARLDFATFVDAARRAADLLRDRCGVDRLGFVGARLAALVSARAVRRLDGSPLALWEPVVDPAAAATEAARTRRVADAPRSGRGATGGPPTPRFDVFDTPLGAELADGTRVADLLDEMGVRPRPVLVAQTGPGDGDGLRPEYASVVARCREAQIPVEAVCHPCDGRRDGNPVPVSDGDALVEHTAAWLAARLGAGKPEP
jgi:hypothetical protein